MNIQRNHPLRAYNTLRLQARAEAFARVASDTALLQALEWARTHALPVVPIGEGSNMVLAGDIKGLVIRQETRGIEVLDAGSNAIVLRRGAGEIWHELVRWTLQRGYYGLENLALIPGTAGAAPIQNIGAYGVELRSVVDRVHATRIDTGERVTLDSADCKFDYRDSIFKHELVDRVVITAIDLRLSPDARPNISYPALINYFDQHPSIEPTPAAVFDAVVSIRRSRLPDPAVEPNAGSFFKNPVLDASKANQLLARFPAMPIYTQVDGRVKVPAAWMIEHCGWKGFRREDVGVHGQHALVLVNYGAECGQRLLRLAGDIAESVRTTFGIELEVEPRLYGSHT